jgi:hypothetical protein
MARPKQHANENREPFSIRLSAAERETIGSEAKKLGLSPSEYVRLCALRGTVRIVSGSRKADPALMLNLLAIGNNLNQIARKMNAEGRAPDHLEETLSVLRDLLTEAGKACGP